MMRLIDADALMDAFRTYMVERHDREKCVSEENCKTCDKSCLWRRIVSVAPPVDAVPVVRCRECKHWKPSGSKAGNSFSDMEYIGGCEFTNYCRRESDFCSYGEKRRDKDGTT